jgi:hypothetical protein
MILCAMEDEKTTDAAVDPVREARMSFGEMLTYANHLGLYAEQIRAAVSLDRVSSATASGRRPMNAYPVRGSRRGAATGNPARYQTGRG